MRIASLHPACTEWIAAFGGAELLVARSHECDFPESTRHVPVVTSTSIPGGDSIQIDERVRVSRESGESPVSIDFDALRAAHPDLIVTQSDCEVCAAPANAVEKELAGTGDDPPEIFSFDPRTMKEVLQCALDLGRKIGRVQEAMALIALHEKRLKRLRDALGLSRETPSDALPSVLCIEWLAPLMSSGNWIPDVVNLAGGRSVCGERGLPSRQISWDEIVDADPDAVAILPCGFSAERSLVEMGHLEGRTGWNDLSAVRRARVYIFDGRAYFNRPGPRLYRSIELMAAALYGDRAGVVAETWEVQAFTTGSTAEG